MHTDVGFLCMLVTVISATLQPFNFNEIVTGTFNDFKWNGTWISVTLLDTVFWFKDNEYNVRLFDATNNISQICLTTDVLNNYPDNKIVFSEDMEYVLIMYNEKTSVPHLNTAQYTVYNIPTKEYHHLHNNQYLQRVKWSPKGHGLVYVYENNIYYVFDVAKILNPRQITRDGISGIVYNGVTNYIYEGSTLWFSPNGKRLAFAHFDDTNVSDFYYVLFGESSNQYPTVTTLKYPKVGTINPKVMLKYVNLDEPFGETVNIEGIVNVQALSNEYVYEAAAWVGNDDVVGVFSNRVQNVTAAVRCNLDTSSCVPIYIEHIVNGWNTMSAPFFKSDGSMFLIIAPESEENDKYNHMSLITKDNFVQRKRLTYGKRVVSFIYKWDEARNLIYYSGSVEGSCSTQQVFMFNLNTNSESCLTCNFITPEGVCKFASADFSLASSYGAIACNGPGPTIVHIQNLENLKYVKWENNENLRKVLSEKLLPIQKNLEVNLKNNVLVYVRLLLPQELDETADAKYPMIVYVYGGPNSNLISDEYLVSFENYFVTNRKYIYAFIDGRGSGRNGNQFMFQVYRQLGSVEVEDQVTVTKYLHNKYSFIDVSKTGIWGGSYGGFLSLLVLTKDTENVFKCGLAIAPVTNFIHYSSIYTEKYMGLNTEQDNARGYDNTDISKYAESLRNKLFCIIHGNADSNVHYQQSMLLVKALQKKDITFYQQSYPDENHNFENSLLHLYKSIDKFFEYGFSNE